MVDFAWLPWFGLDSGWAALCACTTKGPGVETHGSGRVLVAFSPNKRVVLMKGHTYIYIYTYTELGIVRIYLSVYPFVHTLKE